MIKRFALVAVMALFLGGPLAAKDRAWQTGIWRDVQVSRPKVVIGLSPGRGNGAQASSGMTETRTYVIETDTLHLELKETTRSDMPYLDATRGEPVTFALEKDTVYIKDDHGREHAIHVTKQTPIKHA